MANELPAPSPAVESLEGWMTGERGRERERERERDAYVHTCAGGSSGENESGVRKNNSFHEGVKGKEKKIVSLTNLSLRMSGRGVICL